MMMFRIILSEQTPAVPKVDGDVKEFITQKKEMLDAFLEYASGLKTAVGLAANQTSVQEIGDKGAVNSAERLMLRCFAIMNLKDRSWRLIIDPVITEYIGAKFTKSEGCLTWPQKKIIAERNIAVKVSYYTLDGEKVENEIYRGFEAQIWQHECNHLNGVEERVEENTFFLPHQANIGRNDDCPCGSGKKYKKCCQPYVEISIGKKQPTMDEQLGAAGQRLMGKI